MSYTSFGWANPRANVTDAEKGAMLPEVAAGYALRCDLLDQWNRVSRFWFYREADRAEFARLFNLLHEVYGHTTRAVVAN